MAECLQTASHKGHAALQCNFFFFTNKLYAMSL